MVYEIFSINYIRCLQDRIEKDIKEGELEMALDELDSLTAEEDPVEEIKRRKILEEGYRAIAHAYRDRLDEKIDEHDRKTIEKLEGLNKMTDLLKYC